MQSFNPELKVGMQAMIVGTRLPEHSHHIGKIVTIEDLADAGEVKDAWFTPNHYNTTLSVSLALISGIGKTVGINGNMSTIQQKNLMPLPPLDDDDMIFANENVKETEKCS